MLHGKVLSFAAGGGRSNAFGRPPCFHDCRAAPQTQAAGSRSSLPSTHFFTVDARGSWEGRQLAERLTAARAGLRVLYTSGYTDDAIAHHGVLDPGTQFIGKPYTAAELTRKVRDVIDGR